VSCTTLAYAYQFLLGTDGAMHFTAEGNRRIAALRQRLRDLQDQPLTIDQLSVALDDAANELRDVLANQLVAASPPETTDRAQAPDAGDPAAAPSATPPPDATASPTATPTASPAPTPTATPVATATPEPTATP
jgi:hypothetical protein